MHFLFFHRSIILYQLIVNTREREREREREIYDNAVTMEVKG